MLGACGVRARPTVHIHARIHAETRTCKRGAAKQTYQVSAKNHGEGQEGKKKPRRMRRWRRSVALVDFFTISAFALAIVIVIVCTKRQTTVGG